MNIYSLPPFNRAILTLCLGGVIAGCSAPLAQRDPVASSIRSELEQAAARKSLTPAANAGDQAVKDALLPPLNASLPKSRARQLEPRFDLVVSRAPTDTVLMSIVSGTRYNMVVNPKLAESTVTVNLRDVTVIEALDTLRDLYEIDWRMEGSRIYVDPPKLQTRVFRINYIAGQRSGSSDLHVTSSSITSSSSSTGSSTATPSGSGGSGGADSSKISTTSNSDFWKELQTTLAAIVGEKDGRSITLSPQSGMVVIKAMPVEQRVVENYLKAMQLSVNRQVILEAKIIEVQLNESYQSGINWGGMGRANGQDFIGLGAAPAIGGNAYGGGYSYTPDSATGILGALSGANSAGIGSTATGLVPNLTNLGSGGFGFAVSRTNFSAMIQLLEGQGKVNVLSSPRIATLNNQKAVLKVGTDDFYVTNISVTQTTGTTTNTPSVTLRPFFSGIALDVTPQIDDQDNVILHVHPSISVVSEKVKTINAGVGSPLVLPLASSSISETDSIIRASDGQVVVIGGLMSQSYNDQNNRLPGADGAVAQTLLGSVSRNSSKRELVILMKATIINSDSDWSRDIAASRDRAEQISNTPANTGSAR